MRSQSGTCMQTHCTPSKQSYSTLQSLQLGPNPSGLSDSRAEQGLATLQDPLFPASLARRCISQTAARSRGEDGRLGKQCWLAAAGPATIRPLGGSITLAGATSLLASGGVHGGECRSRPAFLSLREGEGETMKDKNCHYCQMQPGKEREEGLSSSPHRVHSDSGARGQRTQTLKLHQSSCLPTQLQSPDSHMELRHRKEGSPTL